MSRELWFLRHGQAEPKDARPDRERRLTELGRRQSELAGAALAHLKLEFELVLASPRVRALDTAALACVALDLEPVVHEPLSSGFDAREADALVRALSADARLLIVGHEPDLSQTIHDLTGARVALRKGGVAGVRIEGSRGELVALMRPTELASIAG